MTKLLHVEASPRKERSSSIAVANAVLAEYRALHPDHQVETWDLWAAPLPEFDNAAIEATYLAKRGAEFDAAQSAAWDAMTAVFDRFASADKLVISLPMWNFGIPYKLKHLIDLVTLSGKAFRITPEGGYEGLLKGKRVVVVYASGGEYSGSPTLQALDHQQAYMNTWLGFVGLTDARSVVVAPTQTAADQVQAARGRALAKAKETAAWL